MSAGRTNAGVRIPARTPSDRSGADIRLGRPGTTISPHNVATAPATNTGEYPTCWASHTPSGSATTDGIPTTTPYRPRPSPCRSCGTNNATSALPTTTVTAKPRPRTRQTTMITARIALAVNTSAGTPSSIRDAATTSRYPKRATRRGVASSPTTVENINAAVVSPAATSPPLSPDVAYSGTTESSK